jgi:hypothetical protein
MGTVLARTVRPVVEVVRASDRHIACLAEFYRQVWDPASTPERVRRARTAAAGANPVAPGEEPPTFLFLSDGRVLGHVTTIPERIWSGNAERGVHWMKGLMVLPEFRKGPIGFSVLKEAVRQLGCTLAIAVQPDACRLFEALGFASVGTMSNHLRVLNPGRLLTIDADAVRLPGVPPFVRRAMRLVRRRPLASVVGAGSAAMMRALTLVAGVRALGLRVCPGDRDVHRGELNSLWHAARKSMAAATVRDAEYVHRRYGGDGAPYGFVTVRERSALVGLAVVRRPGSAGDPRLGGLRVATLSDMLLPVDRTDVAAAALAGAETLARSFEADAVVCSASHPRLRALLPLHAYVPLPGTLRLLTRDPKGACGLPPALSQWWLTRGDGDADETF